MSRTEADVSDRQRQAPTPEQEPAPGEMPEQTPEEKKAPWPGWEPLLRAGGSLVSVVAAFVTGVLELLLTPLRAGDVTTIWRGVAIGSGGGPLLGVSILLAVLANYGIAWFAVSTTGRRWALGPPWALWTVMMMLAAGVRTAEGDYLLAGDDWIALVAILAGSLAFAVYAYRMILKRAIGS